MSRAQLTSTVEQNTGGAVAPYVAGKNILINGGMDIWQRGTSLTASGSQFIADRWNFYRGGYAAGIGVSRITTSDTTNLPNIQYAARVQRTAGDTSTNGLNFTQNIETVNTIPLAGKTVTVSFYARAGANYSGTSNLLSVQLVTGTGTDETARNGFAGALFPINSSATLTTIWQRFTFTGTISTSATDMGLAIIENATGTALANDYYDITGVQLEIGSIATPFSRCGSTLQGELALCQRYFQVVNANALFNARSGNTTLTDGVTYLPVTMRTPPALAATAPLKIDQAGVANFTQSSASVSISGFADAQNVGMTAGNFTGLPSANVWLFLRNDGGKIWMSAEL